MEAVRLASPLRLAVGEIEIQLPAGQPWSEVVKFVDEYKKRSNAVLFPNSAATWSTGATPLTNVFVVDAARRRRFWERWF